MALTWAGKPLTRYYRQAVFEIKPGGDLCWCCGQPGRPCSVYGTFECARHEEGPVTWYAGAKPLVLSGGQGRR